MTLKEKESYCCSALVLCLNKKRYDESFLRQTKVYRFAIAVHSVHHKLFFIFFNSVFVIFLE